MDFFKKATIGILTGLTALTLVASGINKLEEEHSTKVLTISQKEELTIKGRSLAFAPMLIAPYKTMDVFLSEIQKPGFTFTSAGGSWELSTPKDTKVEAEVKFKINGRWTDWISLDEELDLKTNKTYALAATNPATEMQYRFLLYGDGISTPRVKNIDWTFIKTGTPLNLNTSANPKFASVKALSNATYLALNSDQSGVISRSGWGADESYRYLSSNDVDPVLIEIDDDYYEKYKDELTYSRVVEEDEDGDKYKWPLQYPEKVKKFIIHHTATTGNLDNPTQAIRDIYYYHAITRGWGDIGYNYIIDQDGKVYEGRYGGEGVIGAHAGPGNNGSIGISILGNYEENEVSGKIIGALSEFIAKKSKVHNIDPAGSSEFRGHLMQNVFGHSDIMSTDCPGVYLYEKLPIIRSLAAKYKKPEKEKFVKDYDYEDKSGIYYVELKPEETKEITIKMENIGKQTWDNKTYIVVDDDPAFKNVISFPSKDGSVLAKMQEKSVKSGKTATFKFKMTAGKKGEIVYMNIAPIMNGAKKPKDYITFPVAVQQSNYKYQLVDSKFPGAAMEKGETFEAWVKLKNTGNVTWRKTGESTVTLGTDHERDRKSQFVSPQSTRLGFLKEAEVKPGETGTFLMNLKAPDTAGYYKEYFTPVVEGETWMRDSGMYFETTVYGDKYGAELVSVTASEKWQAGEKYLVKIKLRNLGKVAWTKNNLKMVFLKETDLKVTEAKLLNDTVETGKTGTISFVAEVDKNEKLEKKTVLVRPKVDGNQLLKRPIYIYYTVIASTKVSPEDLWKNTDTDTSTDSDSDTNTSTVSNNGPDIRVKLSFSGTPQITANGSFEIYDNDKLVKKLGSGEIVEVKTSGAKYKVTYGGKTYTKTGPIRFVPKDNAILEIDNYEHRPEWNLSLNDNEYRGNLEVKKVDGALVVINELPLEKYLKGLGEVSNGEETEKIKAIMVAARSYAKYYIEKAEKFPGKPYNLDDDPNNSQKYLGYGLEKRAPNVSAGVTATNGEVVTYDGELVKTPYFNQSDGTNTKSALDVWGWDAPYLVSVSDSYCNGDEFLGHGVGLSGCGAKGMAQNGFSYLDILKHYYTGVEIVDQY